MVQIKPISYDSYHLVCKCVYSMENLIGEIPVSDSSQIG